MHLLVLSCTLSAAVRAWQLRGSKRWPECGRAALPEHLWEQRLCWTTGAQGGGSSVRGPDTPGGHLGSAGPDLFHYETELGHLVRSVTPGTWGQSLVSTAVNLTATPPLPMCGSP